MTLARLLSLAYWGAGLDDSVSAADCEEIKDFALTWLEYARHELEDITIDCVPFPDIK